MMNKVWHYINISMRNPNTNINDFISLFTLVRTIDADRYIQSKYDFESELIYDSVC